MPRTDGKAPSWLLGSLLLLVSLIAAFVRDAVPVEGPRDHGHERTDTRPGAVVGVTIALLLSLAVVLVLVTWYQAWLVGAPLVVRPPEAGVSSRPEMAPGRLEAASGNDRRALEAGWRERLGTYGWVDHERRIVHVPIERAMELLLEQGLPSRAEGDPFRELVAAPSASGRFVERSTR